MKDFIYYLTRALHVFFGIGNTCRFVPTCSQYASETIQSNGLFWGTLFAIRRILRCHPWGSYGNDPVSEARFFRRKK